MLHSFEDSRMPHGQMTRQIEDPPKAMGSPWDLALSAGERQGPQLLPYPPVKLSFTEAQWLHRKVCGSHTSLQNWAYQFPQWSCSVTTAAASTSLKTQCSTPGQNISSYDTSSFVTSCKQANYSSATSPPLTTHLTSSPNHWTPNATLDYEASSASKTLEDL